MGRLSKYPEKRFQFPNTGDLYCDKEGFTEVWDGKHWRVISYIDPLEPLESNKVLIEDKIKAFEEELQLGESARILMNIMMERMKERMKDSLPFY
jgi:hypothetical protein